MGSGAGRVVSGWSPHTHSGEPGEMDAVLNLLPQFPLSFSPKLHRTLLPTSRENLPSLVNFLWKHLHRGLLEDSKPIELSIKVLCYKLLVTLREVLAPRQGKNKGIPGLPGVGTVCHLLPPLLTERTVSPHQEPVNVLMISQ